MNINKKNFCKYMCQFIIVFLIHYNISVDKYNSFIIAALSATTFVYLDLYYPAVVTYKEDRHCSY
jgi:hypothetical protein